jgi:hypothetical protein
MSDVIVSKLVPALTYLLGYIALVGDVAGRELVKEAVKRYAPKAFGLLDETVERLWNALRQGKVAEAETIAMQSGLAPAIEASAAELRGQTLVLHRPKMTNGFEARLAAIRQITEHFLIISREWKADLILRGSFSGPYGLTVFQSDDHVGRMFQTAPPEISFVTCTQDHLLWVDRPQLAGTAEADFEKAGIAAYRKALIDHRTQTRGHFRLSASWLARAFRPAMHIDGGAIEVNNFADEKTKFLEIMGEIEGFFSREPLRRPVDDWASGTAMMWRSLLDMPAWLQLDEREAAALADLSKLMPSPQQLASSAAA